jgi:hypothetical protein
MNVAEQVVLVNFIGELMEKDLFLQGWIKIVKQLHESHDLCILQLSILTIFIDGGSVKSLVLNHLLEIVLDKHHALLVKIVVQPTVNAVLLQLAREDFLDILDGS